MTYGYGIEKSELEQAFDKVEQALRKLEVRYIELEYSEGVEVVSNKTSTTKCSLFLAFEALNKKAAP